MRVLLSLLIGCICVAPSIAQVRDLTFVVGFAAGGTSSTAARILADSAATIEGAHIVVENIPTAGGKLAASRVMQNETSQMLLVMSATSLLRIPPDTGLVPVGIFAQYKYVAVTRKGTSRDLQAYMAAAKLDKRPRNVGTAGSGSVAHLIVENLFEKHDVKMIHVPYPGSASAIRDVLGEHIDMAVVPMPDAIAQLMNLEILAESGKGILVDGWMGLYAPPATTHAESVRLGALLEQASARSRENLKRVGFESVWLSGGELRRTHERDYTQLYPILRKLGIEP
jgi:tripartite-type tricarboxylate transporter receptor subunit TctC